MQEQTPAPLGLFPSEPKKPPEHTQFVAAFDALYRERSGSGATWGKPEGGMVSGLLKKHGLAECLKRAERLFKSPPAWLAKNGEVPTLKTLVGNFDALAVAIAAPPAPKPPEQTEEDRERAREREWNIARRRELREAEQARRDANLARVIAEERARSGA